MMSFMDGLIVSTLVRVVAVFDWTLQVLCELRARACVEEACEFRPMSRAKCCVQWSNFVDAAELI